MGKEFYITEDQAGRRIDRLLRSMFPQVPLGAIMKALRKGDVRLDAKKTALNGRVKEGEFLQVPWDDEQAKAVAHPEKQGTFSALPTVYRDENIWVVNKPPGMLTQPDSKWGDSLITRASCEIGRRIGFHLSTVQRLDRNTSGVVTIALNGKIQRTLFELIKERRIKKIYRAVLSKDINKSGRVEFPLLKDPASNTVHPDPNGLEAITIYKRLSGDGRTCTVEIELVTGRSHQARAHMAALGVPIVGDRKYGGSAEAKRPLLHACSVTFPRGCALPEELQGRTFTAPLPQDMKKYFI